MRGASPSADAEPGGDSSGEARRLAGRRSTLVALAAGVAGVAVALVASALVASGPKPDATRTLTPAEPDVEILALLAGEEQWAAIDPSTLRGYEPYFDVEVWSATNEFGSPCLIAFDREANDVVSSSCVPEPAELFIDVAGYAVAEGGRARFVKVGESLDIHLYLPESAD